MKQLVKAGLANADELTATPTVTDKRSLIGNSVWRDHRVGEFVEASFASTMNIGRKEQWLNRPMRTRVRNRIVFALFLTRRRNVGWG
jgi:hypothetical protein